jgi:ribonuclease G
VGLVSQEILINVTPMETRVAFVDDGLLQELHYERAVKRGLVGNIYLGKVVRVLPGMQAAFIDIGAQRTAFLAASDIGAPPGRQRRRADSPPPITDRLYQGKNLLVQVTKDPLGSKGARVTAQLSLSARYLVFLPDADRIAVSQSIAEPRERKRLQQLLDEVLADEGVNPCKGFILRTAA